MKPFPYIVVLFLLLGVTACSQPAPRGGTPIVVISTDMGDIKIKLYDETPQHRDNFLKLAREGFYNDLLFHRVIKQFMIQGGDPASRNAAPGTRLGGGNPGYTIPAELMPALYHKKGALAAARTGDQVNPKRESSGSQFYIVVGKVWRGGELDTLEMKLADNQRQLIYRNLFTPAQEELNKLRQENKTEAFNAKMATLQAKADSLVKASPVYRFSQEQRTTYTTTGGTPHLDGAYTVFGEVIEGLDVLDKIVVVKTDQADRPLQDVKMKVKVIE